MIYLLLILIAVVAIALGIGRLMQYESRRRALREPLSKQYPRGPKSWTDAQGFDHDWQTDPPNGRVVFENKYGKNPDGPKDP